MFTCPLRTAVNLAGTVSAQIKYINSSLQAVTSMTPNDFLYRIKGEAILSFQQVTFQNYFTYKLSF